MDDMDDNPSSPGKGLVLAAAGGTRHVREPLSSQQSTHDAFPRSKSRQEEIDIWQVLRLLDRHKVALVGITACLVALSGLFIAQLSPRFRAESVVLISAKTPNLINPVDPSSGQVGDSEAVESEVQVIASVSVAKKVIASLNLAEDPEFNPTLDNSFSLRDVIVDVARFVLGKEQQKEADTATLVLSNLQRGLDVSTLGRSRAIRITYVSQSATTAANVANAVADAYRDRQLEGQLATHKDAVTWMSTHLTELRQRAEAANEAVEKYRTEHGLVQGKEATVVVEQITSLSQRLAEAKARLNSALATQKDVTRALRSPESAASVDEVLHSPLIQSLKTQKAQLSQRLASLAKYLPSHPEVISVTSQLAVVNETIQAETKKIINYMANEVDRAQLDVERTEASLAELGNVASTENSAGVELRALEREAEVEDTLYRALLTRSKEIEMTDGLQLSVSEIISRAEVPKAPYFPNKKLLFLLSILVSGMVASVAVLTMENSNKSIVTGDQVENWLGAEPITFIPTIAGMSAIAEMRSQYAKQSPQSLFRESIRTLHVKMMRGGNRSIKTVLVASSVPSEGKSSVTVALGQLVASTGRRVIVIDGDLRRPRMHLAFQLPRGGGLSDYLRGSQTLDTVIRRDGVTGVDVITAGSKEEYPADILGTPRMKELLDQLRDRYDLIIIDSPPVLSVPDALVLSPQVESTLFVVRWAKTPQPVAARALRQLASSDARVCGIVLSMVNVREFMKGKLYEYYDGALEYVDA